MLSAWGMGHDEKWDSIQVQELFRAWNGRIEWQHKNQADWMIGQYAKALEKSQKKTKNVSNQAFLHSLGDLVEIE
jgi:hypothetical protein